MSYTLNAAERGYNISLYDGFTSVITGFSGLPYSLRHWELSNKGETKYFFGHRVIAIIQGIPVIGGFAALSERISVFVYTTFFKPTSKAKVVIPDNFVKPKLPIEFSLYHRAKEVSEDRHLRGADGAWIAPKENAEIFIVNDAEKQREIITKVVGKGGSKKAVLMEKGRVLLLPNIDADPIDDVASRWERIVLEEVRMSKILSKIGLLSPNSTQVEISFSENSPQVMPAYISDSFYELAENGFFIIDKKNTNLSTWKHNVDFIFQSDEERFKEENWYPILAEFLNDVAKLCIYNIPLNSDSMNFAVVKKPNINHQVSTYEVRYFGFDFSNKYRAISLPTLEKNKDYSNIEAIFKELFLNLFFWEFGYRYDRDGKDGPIRKLENKLIEKFSNDVKLKIDELIGKPKTQVN